MKGVGKMKKQYILTTDTAIHYFDNLEPYGAGQDLLTRYAGKAKAQRLIEWAKEADRDCKFISEKFTLQIMVEGE